MPYPATREPVTAPIPAWGVVVFESHHDRGFRMGMSRHPWLEVFYVLEGGGLFEIDDRPWRCQAGDVVIVPLQGPHRIRDDPDHPLAMYGLRVSPEVWRADPDVARRLPAGRLRRNKLLSMQVRGEFRRMLFEQAAQRPGRAAMMVGAAAQLLATLVRAAPEPGRVPAVESRRHSTLRQAVGAYIADLDHRFVESTKIDRVASELGLSRRRFTELFRQATGSSWSQYVRKLRVNHAKELLRHSTKSVLSVAFESGFEELSSFYRAFDREEGATPQRWRQKAGQTHSRSASAAPG